ncbi:MAG: glycosyltransferase family 39 protein [Acidobacteriota bacterium]
MFDGAKLGIFTGLACALAAAALLRCAWLTSDPPTHPSVGIVWHDEGAWLHNARNRALWGTWRTDEWNPIFIAPVFTGLEYAAFHVFGVGTWQARTVPVASGLAAVALLAMGLAISGGRRSAVIGAWLLASNYVFVMWNRAALMESSMTAFMVLSWAAYAAAERRPSLGVIAGLGAVLAWFTKAAAAFFLLALAADAVATLALARWSALRRRLAVGCPRRDTVRAAGWTLAGLAVGGGVALVVFVLPNWQEYRFYNWQMSVLRKPDYSLAALADRASWIPIVHDSFTRMWLVTAAACLGITAIVMRWRTAQPAERLLVLWVVLGFAELIVHDSGNQRRYVMFIPALVALSSGVLGRSGPLWPPMDQSDRWTRRVSLLLGLALAYVVVGGIARLAFLDDVRAGVYLSAGVAAVAWACIVWQWRRLCEWLGRQRIAASGALALVLLVVAGDLAQYAQWGARRTALNYDASRAVGRVLPPGTLVHGKLANGLSLENRIRPVFVGRGFGNFADRTRRDDIPYVLTYLLPRIGYEGSVITDVLDAYPGRTVIATFDVAETASGHDVAALVAKFGPGAPRESR